MKPVSLNNGTWFYPVLFAGWCLLMTAIHGGYNFSGSPLLSTFNATGYQGVFKDAKSLNGSIAQMQNSLLQVQSPLDQAQIAHNIGSAYYDLYHVDPQTAFIDSAVGYYSRSIMAVDTIPRFHYNLGRAYADLQNFTEAANCYKKALALDPNHLMALHNLALLDFYQFSNDVDARKLLERELGIGGRLPTCYYVLGEIAMNAKEYDRALDLFQKETDVYWQGNASAVSPATVDNRIFAATSAHRELTLLFSTKFRNQQQAELNLNRYMQLETDDSRKAAMVNEMRKYWGISK